MLWTALVAAAATAFLSAGGIVLGWYLNEQTRSRNIKVEGERRRAAFQQETLVELQEVLSDLARQTYAIHNADVLAERAGGAFGAPKVGDELAERHRVALRRCHILKSRVKDVDIQNACDAIFAASTATLQAPNGAVAAIAVNETGEQTNRATELIGEKVQDLL
jgi:hypothetical protein